MGFGKEQQREGEMSNYTIDGYPLNSRLAKRNDLTDAAIEAYQEEIRKADRVVRNIERRRTWAERWRERLGAYPESYDLPGLVQRLYESTRDLLFGVAGEHPAEPKQTAELLLHPTFQRRRRPAQSNNGIRRIPRRKHQIMHIRLPEPPEAA